MPNPESRCPTPKGVGRVPEYGSPTVRRRRLAAELRRLRERAGFTGDEVADRLGWSGSKISRIELHRTGIKLADLVLLLDLYNVADVHREGGIGGAICRRLARDGFAVACIRPPRRARGRPGQRKSSRSSYNG